MPKNFGSISDPKDIVTKEYLETSINDDLKFIPQALTDSQKSQSRTNIGLTDDAIVAASPKKTMSGTAMLAKDVTALKHNLAWVQYGQCVQSGTPSPSTPAPISGQLAGATVGGFNLYADGDVSGDTKVDILLDVPLRCTDKVNGTQYRITADTETAADTIIQVFRGSYTTSYANDIEVSLSANTQGTSKVFTIFNDVKFVRFVANTRLSDSSGFAFAFKNICISIALGREEYKPVQTLTIKDAENADVTLYGIPVSSGGNVTIAGQQYIADTVEGTTLTRRIGVADLGTLEWTCSGSTGHEYFTTTVTGIKNPANSIELGSMMCSAYQQDTASHVYGHAEDKRIAGRWDSSFIWIYDTTYTDAAAFKTAMSGVMLYYELATPTTETVTVSPSAVTSYSPNVTWLSEAYSEVTYNDSIIDVVNALQAKITELTAAVIAAGGTI